MNDDRLMIAIWPMSFLRVSVQFLFPSVFSPRCPFGSGTFQLEYAFQSEGFVPFVICLRPWWSKLGQQFGAMFTLKMTSGQKLSS